LPPSANAAAGTARAPRAPAAPAPFRICRRVMCTSFMAISSLKVERETPAEDPQSHTEGSSRYAQFGAWSTQIYSLIEVR
jgi:hypothetical protein